MCPLATTLQGSKMEHDRGQNKRDSKREWTQPAPAHTPSGSAAVSQAGLGKHASGTRICLLLSATYRISFDIPEESWALFRYHGKHTCVESTTGHAWGSDAAPLPGVSHNWSRYWRHLVHRYRNKHKTTRGTFSRVRCLADDSGSRRGWPEHPTVNSAWARSAPHRHPAPAPGDRHWANRLMWGQVLRALKLCCGKSVPWGSFCRTAILTACLQQPRSSSKSYWLCWLQRAWEKALCCFRQESQFFI